MITSWSISEVARHSGVTSRTLRHYEALGLLSPAYTGANGYRYYQQEQLLRLQRILLLRDLGLGLEAIGEVLSGDVDERSALAVHYEWLLAERRRLDEMASTVSRTIAALEQGEAMNAQQMFNGFESNPYEEEARQRWGHDAVDRSNAKVGALTTDEQQAMMDEARHINERLASCKQRELAADDAEVQTVIDAHYRWVSFHWSPDADSYPGLGQLYVDDPRFTAFYDDAGGPGTAAYLLEGIKVYAERNLAPGS